MASDVTIYAHPYTPVTFPSRCCYCLEPATTTVPITVANRKIRVSRTRTTSITYPVQVPYCASHGAQARRLQRYDKRATIVLFIAAVLALFMIQLSTGGALRAIGPLVWYGATVLMAALLAIGAVLIYVGGRRLLQRRYPATADHTYRGGLGISAATRLARRPTEGAALLLAITFTFHNDRFANIMAALHNTQARPTPGSPGPP
jgi:hypothetical protein